VSSSPVVVIRRADNAVVQAELIDGVQPRDLGLIERVWTPVRAQILAKLRAASVAPVDWPQSLRWDWSRKEGELKLLEAGGFGVICDGDWQGVMLTKSASHVALLASQRSKPLVYVDYVETAPWNWPIAAIGEQGRYRGVGSVLIREAMNESIRQGFKGRIGLHALPQAERFYDSVCGLTEIGRDPNKQNLLYFECSPEAAEKFLDEGGES